MGGVGKGCVSGILRGKGHSSLQYIERIHAEAMQTVSLANTLVQPPTYFVLPCYSQRSLLLDWGTGLLFVGCQPAILGLGSVVWGSLLNARMGTVLPCGNHNVAILFPRSTRFKRPHHHDRRHHDLSGFLDSLVTTLGHLAQFLNGANPW